MANILRNVDQIFKSDGSEFTAGAQISGSAGEVVVSGDATAGFVVGIDPAFSSGSSSVETNLGIDVVQENGDVNYDFNSLTPTALPMMDTSALAVGATLTWNGTTWATTGLIIEDI